MTLVSISIMVVGLGAIQMFQLKPGKIVTYLLALLEAVSNDNVKCVTPANIQIPAFCRSQYGDKDMITLIIIYYYSYS